MPAPLIVFLFSASVNFRREKTQKRNGLSRFLYTARSEEFNVEIPIEEALTMKKHLQMDRYKIMEIMQFGGAHDGEY